MSKYCIEHTILLLINKAHDGVEAREPTCQTNGTFFKFAMTTRNARIRDLLPGPVNILVSSGLRCNREPAIVMARRDTPAIDLIGNAAADAMSELKGGAHDYSH